MLSPLTQGASSPGTVPGSLPQPHLSSHPTPAANGNLGPSDKAPQISACSGGSRVWSSSAKFLLWYPKLITFFQTFSGAQFTSLHCAAAVLEVTHSTQPWQVQQGHLQGHLQGSCPRPRLLASLRSNSHPDSSGHLGCVLVKFKTRVTKKSLTAFDLPDCSGRD